MRLASTTKQKRLLNNRPLCRNLLTVRRVLFETLFSKQIEDSLHAPPSVGGAFVPAMSMDKEQTSSRQVRKKLRTSWSPEAETTTEIVPTDTSTLMAETWSNSAFTFASEESSGSGTSVLSRQARDFWTCQDCGNTFAVISMLAYLKQNNEAAVLLSDKKLVEQTMQVQHGYSAALEPTSVTDNARLVCVYCCEKYHNKTYLSSAGKPTSAFAAIRKRSSGCHKQCPSAVNWMLNLHDKKIQHHTGYKPEIASKDIYNTLEKWNSLAKDSFAGTLCDGLLSVKVGCRPCLHYPLSSTGFYRDSAAHPETGISPSDWFSWVCAKCGERNLWANGAYRLLTIGSTESIAEGKYLFAYVQEKVSRNNENLMNFMKTCSLRSHIDGKPLSHWMILQAISEMNNAQDERLCAGEVVTFTAKPIPKDNWQLHCEHAALSTGCENKYKAIDVSLVDQEIPILSDELLTKNLDFAAAALDIDMNAHVTPAMTISRTALTARDSYQRACHRLRAICNHVMPEVHDAASS